MSNESFENSVILVTGAARRIGAAIVTRLHENGASVAIHYRGSADDAERLSDRLNCVRENSAATFQADFLDSDSVQSLVQSVKNWHGHLDGLVNNASTFYPTPIGKITEESWQDLMGTNLKAPLFLSQAAAPHLQEAGGAIVNIVDIHFAHRLLLFIKKVGEGDVVVVHYHAALTLVRFPSHPPAKPT